jgi:ribosomal protein S15P/S13E
MKRIITLSFLALGSVACSGSTPQPAANTAVVKSDNSAFVSSHSVNSAKPNPAATASTESPMARPIDVSEMTAGIETAEKNYKQNPKDETAKDNLAKAYFERAFALTDVAQYRAALGDFRKGLKLRPDDNAARKMHDEILRIFKTINREPPKEGEEPQPLPFKKEA